MSGVMGLEGLDTDTETLRDDALSQFIEEAHRSRPLESQADPVNDRNNDGRKPKPSSRPAQRPIRDPGPSDDMPGAEGSQLFKANAGMMRLPPTVERGRKTNPPPNVEAPKSARSTWAPSPTSSPFNESRALVKGQTISLTDTSISAMPSSSRDLVVLYDRDGEFASSVRILATRVEELKARLGFKSFLVTSVHDGDGKSVLANNLALAMSEDSERRVALVDANFRSPRAGELFNLDLDRGLLAALSGDRPLAQCVARVLGRNLIVLHAGGEHKNPASVLASAKFKALLAELYQTVDFMIVDAPSAIPYADVPLIAQHVDAVLMVVTADRTKRAKLDKAMDTIGRSRIHGQIFVDHGGRKSRVKKL